MTVILGDLRQIILDFDMSLEFHYVNKNMTKESRDILQSLTNDIMRKIAEIERD